MFQKIIELLGAPFYAFLEESGRLALLFWKAIKTIFIPPFRLKNIFKQMHEIGWRSLPVVLVTASFTGGVLALQSYSTFRRFHAESLMGTLVAFSMTRELGPVITGLIVAGRVGSAMAAELGTMRVTQQIDALITLAVDPVKYLIGPRFIACLLMLPCLTILADGIGIFGGYIVGVEILGVNPLVYIRSSFEYLEMNDVVSGLVKSGVFGVIIAMIGCFQGFYAAGGAEGVGQATTRAVVVSMMLILISDYFMTALLL